MAQQIINTGTGPDTGDGDDLYVAFTKVNQNFTSLWQYGPVDSNITIGNNTISITNTNGNLVLNPQGVGVVQVNNSVLPRFHNTYSLGTSDLRFRSAYFGTGGVDIRGNLTLDGTLFGNISLGNLIVADLQGNVVSDYGNVLLDAVNEQLTVTSANVTGIINSGNILPLSNATYSLGNVDFQWLDLWATGNVAAGNVLTDSLLYANGAPYDFGQDPGGSNTQVQFNDNGVFAGAAGFTFDKSTNAVAVLGNITAASAQFTSVSANSFAGNGAGLTNLPVGSIMANGTSNIAIPAANGNIVFAVGGIGNVLTVNQSGATLLGNLTVSGNILGNFFVGDGRALTRIMAQRGSDTDNWDTIVEMGVYKVNRTSWAGTTGTPLDSTVFKGLLQVSSETGGITQMFFPGTVTANNVKLQWARSYLDGVWTSWYKVINDEQTIEGGSF